MFGTGAPKSWVSEALGAIPFPGANRDFSMSCGAICGRRDAEAPTTRSSPGGARDARISKDLPSPLDLVGPGVRGDAVSGREWDFSKISAISGRRVARTTATETVPFERSTAGLTPPIFAARAPIDRR